jgi:hypothetical protein
MFIITFIILRNVRYDEQLLQGSHVLLNEGHKMAACSVLQIRELVLIHNARKDGDLNGTVAKP